MFRIGAVKLMESYANFSVTYANFPFHNNQDFHVESEENMKVMRNQRSHYENN